jgi:hypothetical protein
MANIKFSGFTANGTIDGGLVPAPSGSETSFLVGFDSTTPTNNYWTFEQVKAGLAAAPGTAFSIYAADGTIGAGRTASVTDTLTFSGATVKIGIGSVPSYTFEVRDAVAATPLARFRQENATGDGLIVRVDSTSSTVKALSVQNNAANQVLNVYGDGVVEIKGQGYTEQHDQTDLAISWNNSNVVYATLTTGTIIFNPTDAKSGATYILYLRQPASGGPTLINWNNLVLWPGGTPPTLSTAAGATDVKCSKLFIKT